MTTELAEAGVGWGGVGAMVLAFLYWFCYAAYVYVETVPHMIGGNTLKLLKTYVILHLHNLGASVLNS